MRKINFCIIGLLFLVASCNSSSGDKEVAGRVSSYSLINLPFSGKLVHKNSKEIKTSYWGVQAGSLDENIIAKAAEIGIKWTRLQAEWPKIEKSKGVYDFVETDKAFDIAIRNGITPFVTIGKGNAIYSGYANYKDPKLAEIYGRHTVPPVFCEDHMLAYLAYIKVVIERYKGKIKYWEIWNEPNHQSYWGAEPDGKAYGKLVKRTATLIRSIDPDCKIIAGATAGIDPKFTNEFLSEGTAELIDIITYHNYGPVPEERAYLANELWKVINKHNPNIILWQGECGYPSASSTRDYRGRAPWGLNVQAKWLLRQSFTDTYFCKTQLSNYFLLANFGNRDSIKPRTNLNPLDSIFGFPERNGSRVRTWGVNEKCLLTNPDLKEKPAFFAYQNLCAIWNDTYKAYPAKYKFDIVDQGVFYGIKWDDAFPSVPLLASYRNAEGRNLIAWWLPWNMSEYLPKLATIDITIHEVGFKNPVMIDLLEGKVYEVKNIEISTSETRFRNLPLADVPFVICEKELIKIKPK
jgi:hypothetical protein